MHLSSEVALDLLDGWIEPSRLAVLNSHIAECLDCRRKLEQWRHIHSLLNRSHLAHAPEEILRSAATIFDAPIAEARSAIPQIVASIVFDSFAQPALAGARGEEESRQVVFHASDYDVHVKIFGDPAGRHVIGQIFARNETSFLDNARLYLLQNGERVGMTVLGEFGGFEFEEVPQGSLSLQIDLPGITVVGTLKDIETA
jgi:hypothetical protein